MKIKQNKFKIKVDPYEAYLTVFVTDNVTELAKQKMKNSSDNLKCQAIFIHDEPISQDYIIIINYKASPGTIAHEVSHLSLMLLNNCGVEIIKNDEPLAYCIGFLVDKIWNKVQKLNSKVDKVERLVEKDDSIKNE